MIRRIQTLLIAAVLPATAAESQLWGGNGTSWQPGGRLPDFSHAGFACGERVIPSPPVVANVRDHGARGDGRSDDSAAFEAAIAATENGAIAVPPGRYRITRILEITKPGVVLRGAGSGRSILVCPTPLEKIRSNMGHTTSGRPTSNYSWSGGFVWFKGRNAGRRIATIELPVLRGSHDLILPDQAAASLAAGDWIELIVRDDASWSLLRHLYSGDPGNTSKIRAGSHSTSMAARVRGISGTRLSLDRPLRFDLRPEWNPELRSYQPTVTMGGVEQLGFEFPERTYQGHFTELGFNAVAFSGVAHCWARKLRIVNADSGIFASGHFCTIQDVRFELVGARPHKNGEFGHHGISLTGHDNLLTRFDIQQRFIHDITVSKGAGNVASSGRGLDLSFDHHKRAPYDNLFTDIDLGEGRRMWKSGGGGDLGRNSGARGTFWNIRAKRPQKHPGGFGPASLNLVGVHSDQASTTEPDGRWFEAIPPADLQPQNLHQAQWERRMGVMRTRGSSH